MAFIRSKYYIENRSYLKNRASFLHDQNIPKSKILLIAVENAVERLKYYLKTKITIPRKRHGYHTFYGGPPGARTLDTLIKSQVLYQLS